MEEQLLRLLLSAGNGTEDELLGSLLSAIDSVIPSKMCSLWKVNNRADTLSIYARRKYAPTSKMEHEYVHPIEGSLIGQVLLDHMRDKRIFSEIKDVSKAPFIDYHLSPDRVREMGLKRFVCIPIPNRDAREEGLMIDAILTLYPNDGKEITDSIARTIRDHFSLTLSRSRLIRRERLTSDIIRIYETKATKDLGSVMHPMINRVLRKYIQYEGCSVFIWDPFYNRLMLNQTTGIEGNPRKSEVYYYLGEGLTGRIAETLRPRIVNDLAKLRDEDDDLKRRQEHKWKESTPHPGKSFMAIPIKSPSRINELLGVMRFTNRLNPLSEVVDQFSQEDIDLIHHAASLIALYMEYDQSERVRTAFAMQMAHEMLTPAMAIMGSASRLIDNWAKPGFPSGMTNDYLGSILDHSELQIALTRTIEFAWWDRSQKALGDKYQVRRYHMRYDIIEKAKKLVIPLARGEGLRFENMVIEGLFSEVYVDKFAFEQVFFNLLTNAIKYRDYGKPSQFSVKIIGHGSGYYDIPVFDPNNPAQKPEEREVISKEGFLITIEDQGSGVSPNEIEKIFFLGYRKPGIEQMNVRGLGIGLTVVRAILGDFQCIIWVANLKSPTRFQIFLPIMLQSNDYATKPEWREVQFS